MQSIYTFSLKQNETLEIVLFLQLFCSNVFNYWNESLNLLNEFDDNKKMTIILPQIMHIQLNLFVLKCLNELSLSLKLCTLLEPTGKIIFQILISPKLYKKFIVAFFFAPT